jgi:hypothetical protein
MTTGELTREQMIATLTLLGWEPVTAIDTEYLAHPNMAKNQATLMWFTAEKQLCISELYMWAFRYYRSTEWGRFTDEALAAMLHEAMRQRRL